MMVLEFLMCASSKVTIHISKLRVYNRPPNTPKQEREDLSRVCMGIATRGGSSDTRLFDDPLSGIRELMYVLAIKMRVFPSQISVFVFNIRKQFLASIHAAVPWDVSSPPREQNMTAH